MTTILSSSQSWKRLVNTSSSQFSDNDDNNNNQQEHDSFNEIQHHDDIQPLSLFTPKHIVTRTPHPWPTVLYWHRVTILLLIILYTAYYFCRTDLSIALPLLLKATHLSKKSFGGVISAGYAFYASGKIVNGILIDRFGARFILIGCLIGSILCTLAFASVSNENSSIPLFTLIWSLNRIFQSGGHPALTTIIHTWFPKSQHGKMLGLASLSYSLGDAMIRLFLGFLISLNVSWQAIFFVSAVSSSVLVLPSFFFLYSSPAELNLPSMAQKESSNVPVPLTAQLLSSPSNRQEPIHLHSDSNYNNKPNRTCCGSTRWAILTDFRYIVLLCQSPIYTWIREIFNSWAVVYLHEVYALSEGTASIVSLIFPLLSALSSVGGGFLVDAIPRSRRGVLYTCLVLLTSLIMSLLAVVAANHDYNGGQQQNKAGSVTSAVLLMGLAALFSTAPGSWAEGVFPLELASSSNVGTVVALVHGVGYVGAILSGKFVGAVVESSGWGRIFAMMSTMATLNAGLACVYWYFDHRKLVMADRIMVLEDVGQHNINTHDSISLHSIGHHSPLPPVPLISRSNSPKL